MLTIVAFAEIKEGKNAQKVKKNINRNFSILIYWRDNPQKIFEI